VTENPNSVQDDGFDVRLRRSGLLRWRAARRDHFVRFARLASTFLSPSPKALRHLRNKSDRWDSDHCDTFLSDEEKAENSKIMICCSGSKSPLLTLDL
jgi:hypothetical protein